MASIQHISILVAAGIALTRLLLMSPEQRFAEKLLTMGTGWSTLDRAYLFDMRQFGLWQLYLWSFRWRYLPDSFLRKRCVLWIITDSVLIFTFISLMIAMNLR